MNFEPSFFKEEIRSDFLVDEKRKKIWAVELQILEKIDEVCRKHHITYYAHYGTLLGAVRHQGFIPWDDDLDIAMFRDDYEKFQKIAAEEFTEPYF
ncbi:MAG: LicD family protein, partial [Lachnospiraceae bacterium]|nr:LicD family protein [Lachnospiraceae bacterium]